MEYPLTDDMKDDGTPIIKVFDFKHLFDLLLKACEGISKFRGVVFKKEKAPLSRTSMTGYCSEKVGMLKCGLRKSQLNAALLAVHLAYQDFLPIKPAKLNDVQSQLKHVNLLW